MALHNVGSRVTVNSRGGSEFNGRTGTVVNGTLWVNSVNDPGDRTVVFDDEPANRYVFEGWMLDVIPSDAPTADPTDLDAGNAFVCTTCALTAAGYDAHELGESVTIEYDPLALLTGYRVIPTDEEPSFSWSDCEGCEQTLGGDRYRVHLLTR